MIDQIGNIFNPAYYHPYVSSLSYYFKYIITFFNLNEIWFSSAKPPTNAPFWSLAYEVWYYIIFAIWMYTKKAKRYALLFFVVLCIGYKILLLFPIWLMGVALYKCSKYIISNVAATILFVVTSIFIIGFATENIPPVFPVISRIGDPYFFYSYDFLNDIFLAVFVCLNIFSVNSIRFLKVNEESFFVRKMKGFSSITFSVYLYHFPIMLFCGVMAYYNKENILQVFALLVGIIVFCSQLAQITEQKRFIFKKWLEKKYSKYVLKSKDIN